MLKHRHLIRKKEAEQIFAEIEERYSCTLVGTLETADFDDCKVLLINGNVAGLFIDGTPVPTVSSLKNCRSAKRYVTVDDGAIRFVLNGADVMAPGITDADSVIKKQDIVWIRDQRNLPLAVGVARMTGEEMKRATTGKAVTTVHHIGDKIWGLNRP
jgi:PUA domain protein